MPHLFFEITSAFPVHYSSTQLANWIIQHCPHTSPQTPCGTEGPRANSFSFLTLTIRSVYTFCLWCHRGKWQPFPARGLIHTGKRAASRKGEFEREWPEGTVINGACGAVSGGGDHTVQSPHRSLTSGWQVTFWYLKFGFSAEKLHEKGI